MEKPIKSLREHLEEEMRQKTQHNSEGDFYASTRQVLEEKDHEYAFVDRAILNHKNKQQPVPHNRYLSSTLEGYPPELQRTSSKDHHPELQRSFSKEKREFEAIQQTKKKCEKHRLSPRTYSLDFKQRRLQSNWVDW